MEKQKINETDKKAYKTRRLATLLSNKERGDTLRPTALSKEVGIHYTTLVDLFDLYDTLDEAGFKTIRDKNGMIKEILITDKELDSLEELREVKKSIIDLKTSIDNLKVTIKKKR